MFSIISRRAGREMVEGTVCSAGIFEPVQDGVRVNLMSGILNTRPSVSFLSRTAHLNLKRTGQLVVF